jgi:hypothetical protein
MQTLWKPKPTGSREELREFPSATTLRASGDCVGTVRFRRTALPTQRSCNGLVPHAQPEPLLKVTLQQACQGRKLVGLPLKG